MKDAHAMAKELEQRYGKKQRDELRANHPEAAACVEKVVEKAKEAFGDVSVNVVMKEEQRTPKQNNALYKLFTLWAEALNAAGMDMRKTLKPGIDIPWNKDRVKEFLWEPVQEAMTGKTSTTKLNTVEPSEIYAVLDRHLGEKFGIHVPWPNIEDQ